MIIKNKHLRILIIILFVLSINIKSNSKTLIVSNLSNADSCSLRDMLSIAEDGDTIFFYIENDLSSEINISQQLTTKKDLYINGINLYNSDTLTIKQQQDQERILSVEGTYKKVIIDNLKFKNGKLGAIVLNTGNSLTLNNCHIDSNQYKNDYHQYSSGGIFTKNKTNLYLNNCIVSNNWGRDACGIYGYNANIYINNSIITKNFSSSTSPSIYVYGGELFLENSIIANNTLGIIAIYGNVTLNNSTISGSHHSGNASGGAICAYAGTNVKVLDSKIINNYAGEGAGIWAVNNLTLKRSTLSNNRSTCNGGGIYFSGNNLQVDSCIIENNTGYNGGGGFYLWSGNNIVISNSIINNNKSTSSDYSGGGISAYAPFKLINSTISNNTAGTGAGLNVNSTKYHISIINNTFYNNIAKKTGGAIRLNFYYGGSSSPTYPSIELINNTVTNNFAQNGGGIYFYTRVFHSGHGMIKLYNNILANNYNDDFIKESKSTDITYITGSRNIGEFNGDPINVSAEFIPYNKESDIFEYGSPILMDNGGFTNTIKISENSIAKASGVTNIPDIEIPATDQRGLTRNTPPCIGAYEYDGFLKNSELKWLKELDIAITNRTLHINNCICPTHIQIINLSGEMIYNRLISEKMSIQLNKGIYILKIDKEAYKILVN